jgi:uncharacterized delta-60 repeat protein
MVLAVLGCGGSGGSAGPAPEPPIESPTPGPSTATPPTAVPTPTATASSEPAPGELDPRFGDGGKTIVAFSGTVAVFHRGLRVTSDGGTEVLAGVGVPFDVPFELVRIRLRADGQPDPDVGPNGIARPLPELRPWAAAFAPDGGAVVAGEETGPLSRIVVMRLTPAGTVDEAFGRDGVATTRLHSVADALPLADGRIVLAGVRDFEPLLERLTAEGDPDETFGDRGLARLPRAPLSEDGGSYSPSHLAVTADGRVLLSATYFVAIVSRPVLFAFTSSGDLDPGFGMEGLVEDGAVFSTGAIDVAADGRIGWLVGGRLVLLRGEDGGRIAEILVPPTEYGGGSGPFRVTADGGFVAAGAAFVPDEPRRFDCGNQSGGVCLRLAFLLQRFSADGVGDPDFGDAGMVLTDPGDGYGAQDTGASAFLLEPPGRITVAGAACRAPFVCDLMVLRTGAGG